MTHLETMSAAIDFMEAHLQDEITLADVADTVSYSLYHFSRVFSETVHHTPYDYLMRRRLSESAHDLLETDKKWWILLLPINLTMQKPTRGPSNDSFIFCHRSGASKINLNAGDKCRDLPSPT